MRLQIERTVIVAAVALLVGATGAASASAQGKSGDRIPDQYIVVLKSDVAERGAANQDPREETRARALGLLKKHGGADAELKRVYGSSVRGFAAKIPRGQLKMMEADPEVAYIEQDRVITLAPPPDRGKGANKKRNDPQPEAQSTPWGITRVGGGADGTGRTLWVIDTGVDLDHPDLEVDQARSRTFIDSGGDAMTADDGNGHGTHVAGTAAALDNDIGVVGVAAGATVVGVKVLDSRGSGTYSGVIAGIDYVAEVASPGDVANMSLGGPTSQALDDALRRAAAKSILFAVAAGNSAQDANGASPARVEVDNVFTVSAIDSSDDFASFSNFSGPVNPPVEFAAPGVDVRSTWKDGGYNTISGTSMASPHVAGLLLLRGTAVAADGNVKSGDPDGDPDPIAHR